MCGSKDPYENVTSTLISSVTGVSWVRFPCRGWVNESDFRLAFVRSSFLVKRSDCLHTSPSDVPLGTTTSSVTPFLRRWTLTVFVVVTGASATAAPDDSRCTLIALLLYLAIWRFVNGSVTRIFLRSRKRFMLCLTPAPDMGGGRCIDCFLLSLTKDTK